MPSVAQRQLKLRVLSSLEQPIDSAVVRIAFCSDTIVVGKTNQAGAFMAHIPEGCNQAHLWVLGTGYALLERDLPVAENVEYTLSLTEQVLDQVEVVASRASVKSNAEVTTYRISMQGLPPRTKADIALRRLPGVIWGTDGFSLIGARGSASIYVDEVPAPDVLLKQLDASDIDRVEVHYSDHNEPGSNGAIYVYRKKREQATLKGDLSLSGGVIRLEGLLNPVLSYYGKKVDVIAFSSVNYSHQTPKFDLYRDGMLEISTTNKTKALQHSSMAMITAELSSRLRGSFSCLYTGYQNRINTEINQRGSLSSGKLKESQGVHVANLLLAYKLGEVERLLLKALGSYSSGDDRDLRGQVDKLHSNDALAELAYEHNRLQLLGQTHRLGVGLGGRLGRSSLYDGLDPYDNRQLRAYVRDYIPLFDGFSMYFVIAGQWGEYGRGERFSYSSFLPSLSLNYQVGGYTVEARYAHNVQHPSADLLSSRLYYRNEFDQRRGNPSLKPQYADTWSLSLSKSFGDHSLRLKTSYWHTWDLIASLYTSQPNVLTYGNAGASNVLNLNLNYEKSLFNDELSLNLYAGVSYYDYWLNPDYRARALTYGSSGWGVQWGGNISYFHPKGWFLNLDLSSDSPIHSFARRETRDPLLSLLVQKSFLSDKLDISLSTIAPFGWGEKRSEITLLRGLTQTKDMKLSLFNVSVGVTYHFGRGEQQPKAPVSSPLSNSDIKRADL